MESMVQDHEKRILALEQNYSEVKKEIAAVQTSQSRIENTLLTQSMEQKELINRQREEQDDLFKQLIGHTLGIKKTNINKKWELVLAIFGGGGFLYVLIDLIVKNL